MRGWIAERDPFPPLGGMADVKGLAALVAGTGEEADVKGLASWFSIAPPHCP